MPAQVSGHRVSRITYTSVGLAPGNGTQDPHTDSVCFANNPEHHRIAGSTSGGAFLSHSHPLELNGLCSPFNRSQYQRAASMSCASTRWMGQVETGGAQAGRPPAPRGRPSAAGMMPAHFLAAARVN
ncbi:hypothetical protein GCM10008959_23790 [Deinococcus seoulensis]|uniref:Uncharacterized protein n=1 Tax=Deinococcus seoulensis TaxID=1837379 RepID=A0ABQ2RRT7_9DEIO|nr:hypothetical protein GCM10008959_23790 [Deinococcus seoulensis]